MTVLLILAAPVVAFPVVLFGGGALVGLFVVARQVTGVGPAAA